jgi:hypothetical protein
MLKMLPRPLVVLGLAGILPQLGLVVLVALHPLARPGVAGFALDYAAVILSFLGGLWWMAALQGGLKSADVYLVAVAPSLIAWAALAAPRLGIAPTRVAILAAGLVLLASPLVDRALSRRLPAPPGWLALRAMMATGLGLTTLALGL